MGVAVLRVVTGTVFLRRGGNRLLVEGLSGIANEISGRVAYISGLEGILPLLAAIVLILVELVCGAALVLGLFTRWVCIPLALAMLVNVLFVHPPPGFSTIDAAYEFSLLRLTASIVLLLTGPGKMALDNIRGLPKNLGQGLYLKSPLNLSPNRSSGAISESATETGRFNVCLY